MSSVVIHPKVEPGVIDDNMLIRCVLEQGPKGEAGRLFAEEGVHLDEVKVIRLEFLNIMRIDHLWILESLTTLSLNHNYIEVIENLEQMVNLKELDLSFNLIRKIEGIDNLINLEILVLSYNQIKKIEHFDSLEKLVVLGLAGNKVKDHNEVLYLRKFKQLRCLSFKENPCCEVPSALEFIKAVLPQVTHIDYSLIVESEREKYVEEFYTIINKLNEADRIKEEAKHKQKLHDDEENFHAMSFVDHLSGPELLNNMFETDPDSALLLRAGREIKGYQEEYTATFVEVMHRLVQYGLAQYYVREKEVEVFDEVMKDAREESVDRSKTVVSEYIEEKEELIESLANFIDAVLSETSTMTEVTDSIFALCDKFKAVVKNMWMGLMKEELTLYELCEDTRVQFATNVKDLGNKMVEMTRACFREWREKEEAWNLQMVTIFGEITVESVAIYDDTPKLLQIVKDKDLLTDVIAQSLDSHMRYIDEREDVIITKVYQWRDDLTNATNDNEVKRNRSRVLEISHYVENQHKEWKHLVEMMFEGSMPPEFEEILTMKKEEEVKPVTKARAQSFEDED